jgi:hypothetical protein
MNLTFLTQFIDASKLAGWIRAGVGAAFVAAIAKWPILGNYVDPALQTQIAALLATIVVGYWSQLTKTDTAKLSAVAEMSGPQKQAAFTGIPDSAKIAAVEAIPDVSSISVKASATDGVADALNDPTRPKVVAAATP